MPYQLESLAQMNNYYSWILDEFTPFIGQRVLEIGAGNGNFSRLLLTRETIEHLWLVEPDADLSTSLENRFAGKQSITVVKLSAEELTHAYLESLSLDTIIMVNVLEHIENDLDLLRMCEKALLPGGKLLTFSPAFPMLYSNYDRLVGHFRRYRKNDISSKFIEAGFKINCLKYFNILGFISWLILVRLLKSNTFGEVKLRIYEKIIVLLQIVEQRINPPFGQSIISIGEKQKNS